MVDAPMVGRPCNVHAALCRAQPREQNFARCLDQCGEPVALRRESVAEHVLRSEYTLAVARLSSGCANEEGEEEQSTFLCAGVRGGSR